LRIIFFSKKNTTISNIISAELLSVSIWKLNTWGTCQEKKNIFWTYDSIGTYKQIHNYKCHKMLKIEIYEDNLKITQDIFIQDFKSPYNVLKFL
jgi:hypothetical protein